MVFTTSLDTFSTTTPDTISITTTITPLFQTMMVQAQEEGAGSEMHTVPQPIHIINHSSHNSKELITRRQERKKQNIEVSQPSDPTQPMADETENVESVPIHSNDPLLSGEDRLKVNELLELCTKLFERVLDLENTKTSQAAEITKLKKRVKKLERRNKSRTSELKRLRKVGRFVQVVSLNDEEVTLVDKAQRRIVDEAKGKIDDNLIATTTTVDELTLAQTLIEIKAVKPKAVTTVATTTTTTVSRPKVIKTKQAKMIEPERPLKKKDQILVDEEIAQRLQEELQAELEEEERLARQKEEEDNLISWDNT
ncbi:hypothetical protein Tco_1105319 [Tanacetum coccineum]